MDRVGCYLLILALKPAAMKSSRTATEGKLLQDYEKLKNEAKEKMQEVEKTVENIKSEASETLDPTAKTELWIQAICFEAVEDRTKYRSANI